MAYLPPKGRLSSKEKKTLLKHPGVIIPGTNEEYEVFENGVITRCRKGIRRLVFQRINYYGYMAITIHGKSHLVHRIFAAAYLPNPDELPVINHKNGVKTDNRISNLEWCTQADNMRHAHSTNLINRGNLKGAPKKKVSVYTINGEYLTTYPSGTSTAKALNCSTAQIYMACNGRIKTTCGLILKYAS